MKIRIIKKNKLLTESDGQFPVTARYRQTQSRKPSGNNQHAPKQIQDSRIEIAMNIDRFLQRPFVTVGEEIMNDDGELVTITDAKDTNLLLYVYRGISDQGEIMNGNDVGAVNRELTQRVEHFLLSLDNFDKKVLASDIDQIINYMIGDRSSEEELTHQSHYMLGAAPGHFDDFTFAARSRSVYKDTRAGKDFMLKKTPELKNIPTEHHFLFSMENLMGRVKTALNQKPPEGIPYLDPDSYDANYRLGVTTETVQREEETLAKDKQAVKAMSDTLKSLFVTAYQTPNSPLLAGLDVQEQISLMEPHFINLIQTTIEQMHKREKPENFLKFIDISENVPSYFLEEYQESIDSIIDGLVTLDMI